MADDLKNTATDDVNNISKKNVAKAEKKLLTLTKQIYQL